jgi:hypothetical protein
MTETRARPVPRFSLSSREERSSDAEEVAIHPSRAATSRPEGPGAFARAPDTMLAGGGQPHERQTTGTLGMEPMARIEVAICTLIR